MVIGFRHGFKVKVKDSMSTPLQAFKDYALKSWGHADVG